MDALLFPSAATAPQSYCLRSALGGGGAWILAVAILWPGWAAALFLLAPLVLVPLGLALAATSDRRRVSPRLWQAGVALQLPAALALAFAFALPPGPGAAALTLPWLAFTLLTALLGLLHLHSRGARSVAEACIDAGLVYLAVGGTWALLSRWGARPLDFSDIIVLATAVHFHYAGFVLPLLTGLAGRVLPGRMFRLAAAGVVIGVPLVALGITLSALGIALPEWLAAWFMAAASILTAGLQLRVAARSGAPVQRLLLTVSGLSLLGAMTLAGLYALGSYWGLPWLDIPTMLPTHGAVNALGFALPGLLAWTFADKALMRLDDQDW
jgi:hypothetical protein